MKKERFMTKGLNIQDNAPKGYLYLLEEQGGVNALCNLINGLNNKCIRLENENKQLTHDASILIQSNSDYRKENEQLKSTNMEMEDYLARLEEENKLLKNTLTQEQEIMKELKTKIKQDQI